MSAATGRPAEPFAAARWLLTHDPHLAGLLAAARAELGRTDLPWSARRPRGLAVSYLYCAAGLPSTRHAATLVTEALGETP